VMSPADLASLKTATAHSLVISGSLYVLTRILAPWASASRTRRSGEAGSGGDTALESRNACEVTQFWQ
jgi:hypothetical protein